MSVKIGVICSIPYTKTPGVFAVNQDYVQAIVDAGGVPVIIPANYPPEQAAHYVDMLDGFLVPGGEDVNPACYNQDPVPSVTYMNMDKDLFEIALIKGMANAGKPVFGICRGMQVINVCYGGTLIQDIPSQTDSKISHAQVVAIRSEGTHKITTTKGSLMADILGDELLINSYHHQAMGEIAEGFVVTAVAPDGIIEAFEHSTLPIYAVQWHPEGMYKRYPAFKGLFTHLISLAEGKK